MEQLYPMSRLLSSKWLFFTAICYFLAACQAVPDEDVPVADSGATLKVQARSAEEVDLIYPLYLYAFSENGKCVDTQVIQDADEVPQFALSEGNYRIIVLSGVSKDYLLPEQPTLDGVIVLENSVGASTPLMVGKSNVVVSSSSELMLNVVLSYAVSAIGVTLKEIPSDVEDVTLSLSPVYGSLTLNGEYGKKEQSLQISCEKVDKGEWHAGTCYVFPGSASETLISVIMKKSDGKEIVYSYTYQGAPQAKHPFNIVGKYAGEMIVDGSFVIEGWGEATDVVFEFGASATPDIEEDDSDLSGIPKVGSIWNGTIVASVSEADASGVDLLLLSLEEWDSSVSTIEDDIDEYNTEDDSGWRLPTHEEAKLLQKHFSGEARLILNKRILAYNSELYDISGIERYLCMKGTAYYSFIFAGETSITKAGEKRTYYTRLVKNYHLSL